MFAFHKSCSSRGSPTYPDSSNQGRAPHTQSADLSSTRFARFGKIEFLVPCYLFHLGKRAYKHILLWESSYRSKPLFCVDQLSSSNVFPLHLKYNLQTVLPRTVFRNTHKGYASTTIFLLFFSERKDDIFNKRKLTENSDCFKNLEFTLNYH